MNTTKRTILFLIALSVFGLLSAQDNSTKSMDDGNYYRSILLYSSPTLIVRGLDADSIVGRYLTVLSGGIDSDKSVTQEVITTTILNRGDTLFYSKEKNTGVRRLYLTNDGYHLSQIIETDSKGDTHTIISQDPTDPNLELRKKMIDGILADSMICVYHKDYIAQKSFLPNAEKPYKTATFRFDDNNSLIAFNEEYLDSQIANVITYDYNNIWDSLTVVSRNTDGYIHKKSGEIETELNECGDWIKASMSENGKLIWKIEREIFYKKKK